MGDTGLSPRKANIGRTTRRRITAIILAMRKLYRHEVTNPSCTGYERAIRGVSYEHWGDKVSGAEGQIRDPTYPSVVSYLVAYPLVFRTPFRLCL